MGSHTSRLALLAVAGFLGLGCGGTNSVSAPGGAQAAKKYENPKLTLANYEALQEGMTVKEVHAMFGEPVEIQYGLPDDPKFLQFKGEPVDSIQSWKDETGPTKEIVVWVKDDKVMGKGQSGVMDSAK